MTRMPGRVYLKPGEHWLKQMASTLARIHNADIQAPLTTRPTRQSQGRLPSWGHQPDLWRHAIAATSGTAPSVEPAFIHGDYQHFNLVWARGRLTGVLDWASGAFGPPDVDVGHCRLNLAVLFSAEWAERFRLAYESEAGRSVAPWWDLSELLKYSRTGRNSSQYRSLAAPRSMPGV
jgi:aminoglycoside phosphotransferase (APT) family kinase protein